MSRLTLPHASPECGTALLASRHYRSTVLRSPRQPPRAIPQTLTEVTGPSEWSRLMGPAMLDLTAQHKDEPQGQRSVVTGVCSTKMAAPCRHCREIWQANAAGRYASADDVCEDVPLDSK